MIDQTSTLISHPPPLSLESDYSIPSGQEFMDMGVHATHSFASPTDHQIRRDSSNMLSFSTNRLLTTPRTAGHHVPFSNGCSIADSASAPLSAVSGSVSSSMAFSPFSPVYQQPNSPYSVPSSLYPTSSHVYSSTLSYPQAVNGSPNSRPSTSVSSITDHSVIIPSRSTSGGNSLLSPTYASSVRSNYATSTPGLNRHGISRNHSESITRGNYEGTRGNILSLQGMSLSNSTGSSYGSNSLPVTSTYSTSPDSDPIGSEHATPPFHDLTTFYEISGENGQMIQPHIEAKIEKGFFYSVDKCWTCYRRNYFTVQCSFSLTPHTPHGRIFLNRNGKTEQIVATGMSLSAVADGASGKTIELVQHTPKRDKGPQNPVRIEKVAPTPPGKIHQSLVDLNLAASSYRTGAIASSLMAPPLLPFQIDNHSPLHAHHQYHLPSFASNGSLMLTSTPGTGPPALGQGAGSVRDTHTFERIQFKSATANNGKRRAQQQYYYLIVELYVDVRGPNDTQEKWVKIAQRPSAAVVVRGRSPSHYHNEGPHSHGTGRGSAGALSSSHTASHHGAHDTGIGPTRSLANGLLGPATSTSSLTSTVTYKPGHYSVDPISTAGQVVNGTNSLSSVSIDALVNDRGMTIVGNGSNEVDAESKLKSVADRYQFYPARPIYEQNGGSLANHPHVTHAHHDHLSTGSASKHEESETSQHMKYNYESESSAAALNVAVSSAWPMPSCGRYQESDSNRGYYHDLNTAGY